MNPGLYWVLTKSEVENGWSVEYFDGHRWDGYGPDAPDEVCFPSVDRKPDIKACPFCGNTTCQEIRGNAMYCGMCGAYGPKRCKSPSETQIERLNGIVAAWNRRTPT